jgi:hypothetical protein
VDRRARRHVHFHFVLVVSGHLYLSTPLHEEGDDGR